MCNAFVHVAEKSLLAERERTTFSVWFWREPRYSHILYVGPLGTSFRLPQTLLCKAKVSKVSSGLKMVCFDSCVHNFCPPYVPDAGDGGGDCY